MLSLIRKFLKDERGFVVSGELVLVATTLVLGCVAGLSALSWSINSELCEVATAWDSWNDGDDDHWKPRRRGYDRRKSGYGDKGRRDYGDMVCDW